MPPRFVCNIKFHIQDVLISGPIVEMHDHSFVFSNTVGEYFLFMTLGWYANKWILIESAGDFDNLDNYVNTIGRQIEEQTSVQSYLARL